MNTHHALAALCRDYRGWTARPTLSPPRFSAMAETDSQVIVFRAVRDIVERATNQWGVRDVADIVRDAIRDIRKISQ